MRRKDLINEFKERPFDTRTFKKALWIIISALDDKLLQSINDCGAAKAGFDELQRRYACTTVVSKMGALSSLLDTKYENDTDVNTQEHVAYLEFQFSPCLPWDLPSRSN